MKGLETRVRGYRAVFALVGSLLLVVGCGQLPESDAPLEKESVLQELEQAGEESGVSLEESDLPDESLPEEETPEATASIELISTEDGWNTWQAQLPIEVVIDSIIQERRESLMVVNFGLSSDWELAQDPSHHLFLFQRPAEGMPDQIQELWLYEPSDRSQDTVWNTYEDKLDLKEYIYPPFEEGQEGGKFGSMVYLSSLREDVGGNRWFIHCATDYGRELDGYNYCNIYMVFEDRYELGFHIGTGYDTLDDPEIKEQIMAILETWEIVSIESVVE